MPIMFVWYIELAYCKPLAEIVFLDCTCFNSTGLVNFLISLDVLIVVPLRSLLIGYPKSSFEIKLGVAKIVMFITYLMWILLYLYVEFVYIC